MEKTKETNLIKKRAIIIASCTIIVVIVVAICITLFFGNSKKLELSDFERIAVYNYLDDYLSLDKLYLLAGKSNYDDLQFTQSKIKQILDEQYSANSEGTISTSTISSELERVYGISSDIDYHGILVSDYEFLPDEDAFKRVDGANSGMTSIENNVEMDANGNEKVSVSNIEKLSDSSYKVFFDVVDSLSDSRVLNSGSVVISVDNGSYKLDSCIFDK